MEYICQEGGWQKSVKRNFECMSNSSCRNLCLEDINVNVHFKADHDITWANFQCLKGKLKGPKKLQCKTQNEEVIDEMPRCELEIQNESIPNEIERTKQNPFPQMRSQSPEKCCLLKWYQYISIFVLFHEIQLRL